MDKKEFEEKFSELNLKNKTDKEIKDIFNNIADKLKSLNIKEIKNDVNNIVNKDTINFVQKQVKNKIKDDFLDLIEKKNIDLDFNKIKEKSKETLKNIKDTVKTLLETSPIYDIDINDLQKYHNDFVNKNYNHCDNKEHCDCKQQQQYEDCKQQQYEDCSDEHSDEHCDECDCGCDFGCKDDCGCETYPTQKDDCGDCTEPQVDTQEETPAMKILKLKTYFDEQKVLTFLDNLQYFVQEYEANMVNRIITVLYNTGFTLDDVIILDENTQYESSYLNSTKKLIIKPETNLSKIVSDIVIYGELKKTYKDYRSSNFELEEIDKINPDKNKQTFIILKTIKELNEIF